MIYFLIYLLGFLFAYLSGRYVIQKEYGKWSVLDRFHILGYSLLSWLAFCIVWGVYLTEGFFEWYEDNKNNPSTW